VNGISETEVNETYRRGLAAVVARSRANSAPTRQTGHRRAPALVAIVGLGIPLIALGVSAFLVIANHAGHSAKPPAASGPPVNQAAIGHTVRITDDHGLVADVTVVKVSYATRGAGALPRNGVFASADVLISTTSPIPSPVSQQEFGTTTSRLSTLLSELQIATINHDTARIAPLQSLIAQLESQLATLAQRGLPFTFTFQTSDGRTYPAFSGNAVASGFEPVLSGAGGLAVGLTYGNVVFDLPSRGGTIRVTDPISTTGGQWRVPPASTSPTIRHIAIGGAAHISDGRGPIADVTVEKVTYSVSGNRAGSSPVNGYYAIADVLISTTSAIQNAVSSQAFTTTSQRLDAYLNELQVVKVNHDTAKIAPLQSLIAQLESQLATLAQQIPPLSFTYVTSDGISHPAFSGNALTSGFVPTSWSAYGALPAGLTSITVVFDVPSKGGAIQLTDPLSNIVEQWSPLAG
jgi:hypothetical protein